ncbi:hypothetical protein DFH09DRAFT_1292500 [Mycena vulgaris]|nr:hypothetical protein DFH09DRAFT_1292500 [Mycena vulgaris]
MAAPTTACKRNTLNRITIIFTPKLKRYHKVELGIAARDRDFIVRLGFYYWSWLSGFPALNGKRSASPVAQVQPPTRRMEGPMAEHIASASAVAHLRFSTFLRPPWLRKGLDAEQNVLAFGRSTKIGLNSESLMSTAAMAGLRTNRVLRPEDKVALAECCITRSSRGPRDAPLRTILGQRSFRPWYTTIRKGKPNSLPELVPCAAPPQHWPGFSSRI